MTYYASGKKNQSSGGHLRNDRLRVYRICFSIKARTLQKLSKLTFFRTLKINLSLATIQGGFIQEK